MRKLILNFAFLCVCIPMLGQQVIEVVELKQNATDISARTNKRDDVSGTPCALIKVQFPMTGAQFLGNVVGSVVHKTNEYWVYMPQSSRTIEVRLDNYKPIVIDFAKYGIGALESNCTYELCLLAKEKNAPKLYEDGMIALAKNDVILGFEKLSKAAEAGYSLAWFVLGNESIVPFDSGYDADPNEPEAYQTAIEYYKKAADKELPEAQCALGRLLLDYKEKKSYGEDAPFNLAKIEIEEKLLDDTYIWTLLEKSADAGVEDAQWYMISKRDWCEKAAKKGIALAEYGMGVWNDDLDGMNSADYFGIWSDKRLKIKEAIMSDENRKTNVSEATIWYKKAADKGLDIGKWTLADRLQEGIGIEKDIDRAIALRKQVAENGNIYCQRYLASALSYGVMSEYYDDGGWGDHSIQIAKDLNEASYWLRRVISHSESELVELNRYQNCITLEMNNLAYWFSEKGNLQEAIYWWQRGAEWGSSSAIEDLTEHGMAVPQKLLYACR